MTTASKSDYAITDNKLSKSINKIIKKLTVMSDRTLTITVLNTIMTMKAFNNSYPTTVDDVASKVAAPANFTTEEIKKVIEQVFSYLHNEKFVIYVPGKGCVNIRFSMSLLMDNLLSRLDDTYDDNDDFDIVLDSLQGSYLPNKVIRENLMIMSTNSEAMHEDGVNEEEEEYLEDDENYESLEDDEDEEYDDEDEEYDDEDEEYENQDYPQLSELVEHKLVVSPFQVTYSPITGEDDYRDSRHVYVFTPNDLTQAEVERLVHFVRSLPVLS